MRCVAAHGQAPGEAAEETPSSHTSPHYSLASTKGHTALGALPFRGGRSWSPKQVHH